MEIDNFQHWNNNTDTSFIYVTKDLESNLVT